QDAVFDAADGNHHGVRVLHADLLQGRVGGRVGLDGLLDQGRKLLHDLAVDVDADDVVAQGLKLEGKRAAEPPQPDDHVLAHVLRPNLCARVPRPGGGGSAAAVGATPAPG